MMDMTRDETQTRGGDIVFVFSSHNFFRNGMQRTERMSPTYARKLLARTTVATR